MKTVKIALLGAGTVGSQVYRLLEEQSGDLDARAGARLEVDAVLVRNPEAERDTEIPARLLTTDADAAIDGADIVIELIGGIEPPYQYVSKALRAGKTVVTGNKALLADRGPELYELAARNDGNLYYEAAVAGAVPVVYGLRESLVGDRITTVLGIVNGTTNFILDSMTEQGMSYEEALKKAQDLGFAEADPSADVDGLDAAAKCAILASLAFHSRVSLDDVEVEGITGITEADIDQASESGRTIKLLAIADRTESPEGEAVSVSVHPVLVPNAHPLASVHGAFNAIVVEGESAGQLMFYGQGAGGAPTATAVLSDVVAAAHHIAHGGKAPHELVYANLPILPADQVRTRYVIRLAVQDRVGVLSEVTRLFADQGVSIQAVQQGEQPDPEKPGVVLLITTHSAPEGALQAVVRELKECPDVVRVESTLRVLD